MHSWQDLVLSAGGLVFAAALVPSVRGQDKPALSTSLLTGGVLLVFSVVYGTLSLWLAMTSSALATVLWLTLAVQKLRSKESK